MPKRSKPLFCWRNRWRVAKPERLFDGIQIRIDRILHHCQRPVSDIDFSLPSFFNNFSEEKGILEKTLNEAFNQQLHKFISLWVET